jgi:hypothetical protein
MLFLQMGITLTGSVQFVPWYVKPIIDGFVGKIKVSGTGRKHEVEKVDKSGILIVERVCLFVRYRRDCLGRIHRWSDSESFQVP